MPRTSNCSDRIQRMPATRTVSVRVLVLCLLRSGKHAEPQSGPAILNCSLLPRYPLERSGYAESANQRLRVLGQSVNDVPALLPGGRDEGADHGEVASPFLRPEAAGDFLPDLHHAPIALGLIGEYSKTGSDQAVG